MSAVTTNRSESPNLVRAVTQGVIAGLIGGVVFGGLMAMMNMLPMVAMLVQSDSPVVGFMVHMVISAGIGASFGLIMSFVPVKGHIGTIVAGAGYGIVWWVLGALILMPLMLVMSQMVLQIGEMQWQSLMGHVIFGIVTGFVFDRLNNRQ